MIDMILDATSLPHDDAEDGAEAIERLDGGTYYGIVIALRDPGRPVR